MRAVDTVTAVARAASFTKRSIKGESKRQALRLALSMVDLTTLEGKDTEGKVGALCAKAVRPYHGAIEPPLPSVAAVCVYPAQVVHAKAALRGTSIKVASVATGFPSGQYPLDLRLADCTRAVADGADEIDMVISRGAWLEGRRGDVAQEIREVKRACGAAHLKIILETGELATLEQVRAASDLAMDAASSVPGAAALTDGEVFIKTSTGKVQPAATMPVTLVMLEAIREHHRATGVRIGMKPAGGIRASKSALHYLVMVRETLGTAWLSPDLFRFGASTLANDLVRQILRLETGRYAAAWDMTE